METNHQLFGHFLRYRMEMQQGIVDQQDENTWRWMKRSRSKALIRNASEVKAYRRDSNIFKGPYEARSTSMEKEII